MKFIPITKPELPDFKKIEKKYKHILFSKMLTNSKYVRGLEDKIKLFLGVKYAVAVSSCTSGLILTLKALGLKGEVIVPSFTFSATGHALIWCGLKPRFVDVELNSCNISPSEVEKAITQDTSAIFATHTWGNSCDIERLSRIAEKHNLRLIFDAAQAFGSRYKDKYIGSFGDAEIFSLSPTKVITSGEGGIVATNNKKLAEMIRAGRNYGVGAGGDKDYDYDCVMIGLNARMSEFHAALGIENLKLVKSNIKKRKKFVDIYKEELGGIRGISFQDVSASAEPNYVYFSIIIDPEKFGITRDTLYEILKKKNIETKKYYFPPLHRQKEYERLFPELKKLHLPNTEYLACNALTLPLYTDLTEKDIERICRIIKEGK